jgi:hypothetical protein
MREHVFDPTPAREKFAGGDRVRMTDRALIQGLRGRARTRFGTVVGFGPSEQSVRVRRHGTKTAHAYYAGFWERADTTGADEHE